MFPVGVNVYKPAINVYTGACPFQARTASVCQNSQFSRQTSYGYFKSAPTQTSYHSFINMILSYAVCQYFFCFYCRPTKIYASYI